MSQIALYGLAALTVASAGMALFVRLMEGPWQPWWRAAVCLALAACVCFLLLPQIARAQHGHRGEGHAEHHDWLKDLKQPNTGHSCCNARTDTNPEGDCRQTRAYLHDDGRWRAIISGKWEIIPPSRVLDPKLSKDPTRAYICEKHGLIFCFLPAGAGV